MPSASHPCCAGSRVRASSVPTDWPRRCTSHLLDAVVLGQNLEGINPVGSQSGIANDLRLRFPIAGQFTSRGTNTTILVVLVGDLDR